MIEWIANRATDLLLRMKGVESEKREIYSYSLEILLSTVWITILVVILSLVFGNLLLALFYYLCFFPLRGYGGGFHAKTHWGCALLQSVCFSITAMGATFLSQYVNWPILIVGYAFIIIIIIIKAPAEHPDNPIDQNKKAMLKNRCLITAVVLCVMAIALDFWDLPVYSSMIFFASWIAILSMLARNKPSSDIS